MGRTKIVIQEKIVPQIVEKEVIREVPQKTVIKETIEERLKVAHPEVTDMGDSYREALKRVAETYPHMSAFVEHVESGAQQLEHGKRVKKALENG